MNHNLKNWYSPAALERQNARVKPNLIRLLDSITGNHRSIPKNKSRGPLHQSLLSWNLDPIQWSEIRKMKLSYRGYWRQEFRFLLWIFSIVVGFSVADPSVVSAMRPQTPFGWPTEPASKKLAPSNSQKLPPEISSLRYPLNPIPTPNEQQPAEQQPAEKQPTNLRSTEMPLNAELTESSPQQTGRSELNVDDQSNQPYRLTARFHLEEGTRRGYVILQVDLAPGAYIHSLTQEKDLNPSKVKTIESQEYQTLGEFLPDRTPTIIEKDPVFEQRLEKHLGMVQFFVPLTLSEGVSAETIQPSLVFDGQVCTEDGVCIPLRKQIVPAQFGGYFHRSAQQNTDSPKLP